MPSDTRTRAYCFTINNWKKEEWDKCQKLRGCGYGCIAPEFCPTTGTPHIQGFVYFPNKKAFSALKKELPRAHWKICNGTPIQNRTYIFGPYDKDGKHKDANPDAIEWGEMPKQGERTDLIEIRDRIANGTKVDDIAWENPMTFHQYGRTLTKLETIAMRRNVRTEMTEGIWYFGKTGVGKSHNAFAGLNLADKSSYYVWNYKDNGFWEGYEQQPIVIIQELRGEISFSDLLLIVDIWPWDVKRKGTSPIPFTSKKVIITSPLNPYDIYKHSLAKGDNMEQFDRRFKIIELGALNAPMAH